VKRIIKCEKSDSVELSKEEQDYYSRQIVMVEMGHNAQIKLKNSKAVVVGVGGLGSVVATQLAAMGVGHLRIVDRDFVEITNLHRQHLYCIDDLGYPKVEAAAKRLRKLNPYIIVEPLALSVNQSNAKDIVRNMDIVVDGLDSMATRYAINRACNELKVAYVFGAAVATAGNLSTIVPEKTACLECFYGRLDDQKLPKCGVVGVHPSVVNVIASLEVSEVIRLLTGREPCLANKLLYFDLEELEFNNVQLSKVKCCPVCGESGVLDLVKHKFVEEVCGRNGKRAFIFVPEDQSDINLRESLNELEKKGFRTKIKAELGLTAVLDNVKVSILKSGVTVIEGVNEKEKALMFFRDVTRCC
jgi:molybdopterin/thiamine biosynthesis adenylyltransferase